MATDFSRTLSLLRQEKGISQRKAAAALGISQARQKIARATGIPTTRAGVERKIGQLILKKLFQL